MRIMASTPCYRREAGSAGRDTRGMLRSHEFDKVEVLAYATPEQAPAMLDELIARAESHHRRARPAVPHHRDLHGDLGQSHHRSFDIEVYAPGVDAWLEVSSISWFSDYQARRADVRYRPLGEKGTAVVHTLNGSALAVPRVWAAIIENNRQADGSIALPEVLWPYLRGHREVPVPAGHGSRGGLMGLADRRSDYDWGTLEREDLDDDPIAQWWVWYDAAVAAGALEPNAMSVATVADDGRPGRTAGPGARGRPAGVCLLHQPGVGQGPAAGGATLGRGDLRLAGAAPPGQAARIASSPWRPARPTRTTPAVPARPASGRGPRRSPAC